MKQKKMMIFSLFILSFLLAARTVKADTTNITNDVHSSANGSDASSNVSITNDVNTGNQSSSNTTSTTHTDIYMNNNGKVKEYHSDQPGSVHIQSDDGNTKVDINNDDTVSQNQSTKEGDLKTEKKENATNDAHIKNKIKGVQSNEFVKFIQKQIQKIEDFFKNLKF